MQNILDTFTTTQNIGVTDLLINIIIAMFFAWLISVIYVKFGNGISNRKQLANSFLLITVCVVLIIALIKSSVALSLGLVGALSIVRFRTAIKEPEELTYLFLCIAVGLGLGANERFLTISSVTLILVLITLRGLFRKDKLVNSYNMNVKTSKLTLTEVIDVVKEYSNEVEFKSYAKDGEAVDLLISLQIKNYKKFEQCIAEINELDSDIKINYVANL